MERDGQSSPVRKRGRASLAVMVALVALGCDGGNATPSPTILVSAEPTSSAEATAPSSPTAPAPSSPTAPAQAPSADASFKHQSVVVAIPDDALVTPDVAAATAVVPSSPAQAATVVPRVADESIDTNDRRLNVTVGGETVFIRNGGRIDMGDGLAVEIYIDPYPPTTLHSILDVYVTQDGEPVPDISVDVEFDMLSMLHGPFSATARDIGGGHHLATLDYIMFGAWDQFVTIRLGLDRIRFPVVIVAYP